MSDLRIPCPTCHRRGAVPRVYDKPMAISPWPMGTCQTCNGSGWVLQSGNLGAPPLFCETCGRREVIPTAAAFPSACPDCGGTAWSTNFKRPEAGIEAKGLLSAIRQAKMSTELITQTIEAVDQRAMATDGPVTPTRLEMTDEEMRDIYEAAQLADGHLAAARAYLASLAAERPQGPSRKEPKP